jgi:hypothetical protein
MGDADLLPRGTCSVHLREVQQATTIDEKREGQALRQTNANAKQPFRPFANPSAEPTNEKHNEDHGKKKKIA